MDPRLKNYLISKYSLMFMIILNVLASIWTIIFDLKLVEKAKNELPDNWGVDEKNEGYFAQYWFVAGTIVMILNIIISVVALYGVRNDSSTITIICSCLFSIIAIYGAWDKYLKRSFVSFIIPSMTSCLGALFTTLNYRRDFHETVPGAARIKYITRQQSPLDVKTFEEAAEKLRSTSNNDS
ncbi:hypothetical protein SSS_09916 [Sarcoptes scabiei]|uniref:Uncharacterized protein n=1 Tax=Sarcoptes scabiei TaxID=52283 RepID=A0A834RA36_SARSC|nr:hypothetical protein SSS_09916 [Sarcoptes scabiei]